jgi:hypothetical protein
MKDIKDKNGLIDMKKVHKYIAVPDTDTDKYIYVLLPYDKDDDDWRTTEDIGRHPTDIIILDSFNEGQDIIDENPQKSFIRIWGKLFSPRKLPVTKHREELNVWVLGDLYDTDVFQKFNMYHESREFIENYVKKHHLTPEEIIDLLVVIIGSETKIIGSNKN